jgi:hypothetical protein
MVHVAGSPTRYREADGAAALDGVVATPVALPEPDADDAGAAAAVGPAVVVAVAVGPAAGAAVAVGAVVPVGTAVAVPVDVDRAVGSASLVPVQPVRTVAMSVAPIAARTTGRLRVMSDMVVFPLLSDEGCQERG